MADPVAAHMMRQMHGVGSKLGLDHDALRTKAGEIVGRELASMTELTTDEKWDVIDKLRADERMLPPVEPEVEEPSQPRPNDYVHVPADDRNDFEAMQADLFASGVLGSGASSAVTRKSLARFLTGRGWTRGEAS